MGDKIIDDYTDLKASRQYKWALRNPDKAREYKKAYEASEKARERKRKWYHSKKTSQQP